MAEASTSEVFNCTKEQFYAVVTDYEKYPEFLSEVKGCHVVEDQGNRKLVEYEINVVKNFKYCLWMEEKPNEGLSWTFSSGDLFKLSNGGWKLEDEADKVRATYYLEAKFKTFVPGPVAKMLINVNLPAMMSSYHKRISELYGG